MEPTFLQSRGESNKTKEILTQLYHSKRSGTIEFSGRSQKGFWILIRLTFRCRWSRFKSIQVFDSIVSTSSLFNTIYPLVYSFDTRFSTKTKPFHMWSMVLFHLCLAMCVYVTSSGSCVSTWNSSPGMVCGILSVLGKILRCSFWANEAQENDFVAPKG